MIFHYVCLCVCKRICAEIVITNAEMKKITLKNNISWQ